MGKTLRTAQEMYGLGEKIDRTLGIIKAHLAEHGRIALHNKSTGEDVILDFNCNLCGKVGNCSIHNGTFVIGDCHHLEFKEEEWVEVS